MAPTKERRALAKAHPPLGPTVASAVAKDGFKRTASGISGGIEHNRRKLEELDQGTARGRRRGGGGRARAVARRTDELTTRRNKQK